MANETKDADIEQAIRDRLASGDYCVAAVQVLLRQLDAEREKMRMLLTESLYQAVWEAVMALGKADEELNLVKDNEFTDEVVAIYRKATEAHAYVTRLAQDIRGRRYDD